MLKPLLSRFQAFNFANSLRSVPDFVSHVESTKIPQIMTAERDFWPGLASQAERRFARRNIVLEDVGITAATLDRYYVAANRLAPVLDQIASEYELDEAIAEWVQAEFEDGTPLHLVADALSGLHHFEP
jgi:hypothetical protein